MFAILVILLIVAVAAIFIQQQRKLIAAQKRELASYEEYMNLINSMPIYYMRVQILKDANNNPVDFKIIGTNGSLNQAFSSAAISIGKKGSESAYFANSMQEFKMFFKIILNEKKTLSFPFYQKLDDTYYDVVLGRSKTPDCIDIFFRDNTEFQKMQHQFRSTNHKLALALEVANIIPWKWDLKSDIINYDDIYKNIRKEKELVSIDEGAISESSEQYLSRIHKEDRERVEKEFKSLIDGTANIIMLEYRVVNIKENSRYVDWLETRAIIEERDENGKPTSIVGSSVMITQRKEQEQELISAKENAEESNRLKTAFLANMSHEIRTPLNAIVGFSGILASTTEDEETREYANLIETNNTLLLQLIGDILDLSKIEAGSLDLFYSDFDLVYFMKGIEETVLQKMPADKPVKIIIEHMPAEEYIQSDMNRIAQILLNLLNNAIKFTNEGSITVGYTHDQKFIKFYVKDTGIGISPNKINVIFDRFIKLDEFSQGTGLGLAVCKMIVENMGGKIGVESEEGKGSTFWFTLPYKQASSNKKLDITLTPKRKLTILIAEDNDSNYNLFANILKNDYHILHAWDGEEAIEMFKEHRPHIVLMDLNMPVVDGYKATEEIRKLSPSVPIIAVTAYTFSEEEDGTGGAGFNALMNKPISEQTLKKELSSVLQRRLS